jgi:hypothetical protein
MLKKVSIDYSITQSEVLTRCLVLALTAPDDIKAQKASDLAEQLARGLTKNQVEKCKKSALKILETI